MTKCLEDKSSHPTSQFKVPFCIISRKCDEICRSNDTLLIDSLGSAPRRDHLCRWQPPGVGCVKLNTDAVCKLPMYLAAAGGLIRDNLGRWLLGFMYNIGACTPLEAELWAILEGLRVAWNAGYRNVLLEADSQQAISAVKGESVMFGNCKSLVDQIQSLLN